MSKFFKYTVRQVAKLAAALKSEGRGITTEALLELVPVFMYITATGPYPVIMAFMDRLADTVGYFDDGRLRCWKLDPQWNDSFLLFWPDARIANCPPVQIVNSKDGSLGKVTIRGLSLLVPPLGGMEALSGDFPELEFRLAAEYSPTVFHGPRHEWWTVTDRCSVPLRVFEEDAEGKVYDYLTDYGQVARYPDWFVLAGDAQFDRTDLPQIQPQATLPVAGPSMIAGKEVS